MANRNSNLITHTIPNLVAGVSQQFTEARFETQVEEMENCVPSIARGVIRRNPVSLVTSNYTTLSNTAFVYTYDRGTGTEQYSIELPGDGFWYVHNINTGELISGGVNFYFSLPAGSIAKECFKAVTIGDYTFIVNTTKTVTMRPVTVEQSISNTLDFENRMIYWVKKTTAVQTNNKAVTTNTVNSNNVVTDSNTTTGIRLEGYTYTIKKDGNLEASVQGLKDTRNPSAVIDEITSEQIASVLSRQSTLLYSSGSFVYSLTPGNWEGRDSFGNEASLMIHTQVKSADLLPAEMPINFDKIVRVTGSFNSEYDDYYLKYDYQNKSWSECVAPNTQTVINYDTMPHVIVRKSLSDFICSPYDSYQLNSYGLDADDLGWKEKQAGDDVTIEKPSFIGKEISNIFFHKNRLGFLTKDSICLSETGDYGNFFGTTAQSLPDDDPIDLIVATTDVTVLRDAVSTAGVLILFSDDSQFTLTSSTGTLTPASATINTASNYTYNSNAKAIANKVYFISDSGGFSQLFAYRLTEGLQTTEAEHLTAHIPSYLPNNMARVFGHSTLGYVFMSSYTDANSLYVLTTTTKGGQDVQNAFHKWTFNFEIVYADIINNELVMLGNTNGDTRLYKMSLEVPGDISATIYLDNGNTPYESKITFSKFHVKDQQGNGTNRGRTQIRTILFNTKPSSSYMCSIYNSNLSTNPDETNWMIKTGFWDNSGVWVDDNIWRDAYPLYIRNYYNDKKVSVLSKSDSVRIEFKNNSNDPSTGFELSTVDIEALFFQRAIRM